MAYITWEYYSSLCTEIQSSDDFERINKRAETKLNMITHMRARQFEAGYREETATEFQKIVHEQIKSTVSELVNAMYQQEISGLGTGISGVSNDGYSESYRITTAAEKEAQLLSIVRAGLSGTGLAGAL